MIIQGGRTTYGQPIGILMLNTAFPRIPGDIGNATTFPYPVVYEVVEAASIPAVVEQADPALIEAFTRSGLRLVERGARAIVTSCGFMAIYQRELAAALPVPVFTSALLQIEPVRRMLGPDKKVGIITANAERLTGRHFSGVGADPSGLVIRGIEKTHLGDVFLRGKQELDVAAGERILEDLSREMLREHPDLGAFVLECTNLPPFSDVIRQATGLPVFDIVTLTDYVFSGLIGRKFQGFM